MSTKTVALKTITYDEYKTLYDTHVRLHTLVNQEGLDYHSSLAQVLRLAMSSVSLALDACRVAEDHNKKTR